MNITYYGHSCFGVRIGQTDLLFDPFISPNELAKAIDPKTIPADYILLSHGHGDHVTDAPDIAKRTQAKVISSFEVVNWMEKNGAASTHPMNHGGKWKFDFGTVKYVNAVHSSSLPDGSYGGHPGGFVITTEEGNFYYSGDTALTLDMQLIGHGPSLDVAFLCIGDNFTMGIEDAVKAADFIKCNRIIGMHYDTFGYIAIDHQEAYKAFESAGKKLHLLDIGQTVSLKDLG